MRLLEHSKHIELQCEVTCRTCIRKWLHSLTEQLHVLSLLSYSFLFSKGRTVIQKYADACKRQQAGGCERHICGCSVWSLAKICPQWSGLFHRMCRSLLPSVTCPLSKHPSKDCIFKCLESLR